MNQFEAFERAKLKRFVNQRGKPYTFFRDATNAFKEPTEGFAVVGSIKGVYHEARHSYLEATVDDRGFTLPEIESLFLCLIDDESKELEIDDYTYIGEKKYKVIKKKDVNNFGLAYDISLEFVDDGESDA